MLVHGGKYAYNHFSPDATDLKKTYGKSYALVTGGSYGLGKEYAK